MGGAWIGVGRGLDASGGSSSSLLFVEDEDVDDDDDGGGSVGKDVDVDDEEEEVGGDIIKRFLLVPIFFPSCNQCSVVTSLFI